MPTGALRIDETRRAETVSGVDFVAVRALSQPTRMRFTRSVKRPIRVKCSLVSKCHGDHRASSRA